MGNECCSITAKEAKSNEKPSDDVELRNVPNQDYVVDTPVDYDKLAINALRIEFRENPQTWVINQLLLSYMFFDDYLEEIRILAHSMSEKAQRLNSELVQNHQKQFFMPDSVLECVNKFVKFEHSDGPRKGFLDNLSPQRMYILHDNVDIADNIEGYISIDKPCYRATLETSYENSGFSKVNLDIGGHISNHQRSSSESAHSTRSSKINRTKTTSTESSHGKKSDSESEYDYGRITEHQTLKGLKTTASDDYTNVAQLPPRCITSIKVKNDGIDGHADSDEEDEVEGFPSKSSNIDLYLTKSYLNSKEFMKHFANNVFPNYLGELLAFSKNSIEEAKTIPGSIFCDVIDRNSFNYMDDLNSLNQHEVIPAITIPWPDQAFEWPMRGRTTVRDSKLVYKWPTDKMIDESLALRCAIIPKGFMPKKGKNPKMDLEWEVSFPKVERYLEFRMSHAQYKVFLFLIILHKKYMEPITEKHGLLIEHIRHLIFWQVEANYKDWLEDKLWNKVEALLKELYTNMGKGVFPHYFINTRNMFKNIPQMYLFHNQQILHKILESPLVYILNALKDIKYISSKFYSQPQLDELIEILESKNDLGPEIEIQELILQQAKLTVINKDSKNNKATEKADKEQQWQRRRLEQERMANTAKLMRNGVASPNLSAENNQMTRNLQINLSKKSLKDNYGKQIRLLTFFITHFIQIAKRSLKISSSDQTMFYLKQATYLTALLGDIGSEQENAKEFRTLIIKEEEACIRKMMSEPKGPLTPQRNSIQYAFSSQILHVKGKDINITKLNQSYNSDYVPKSSIKGKKGKTVKIEEKKSPVPQVRVDNHSLQNGYLTDNPIPSTSFDKEINSMRINKIELVPSEEIDTHRDNTSTL